MKPRIAVYIPSFSDGGVEKMMVTLAGGFAEAGYPTDFLTRDGNLPYLDRLSPGVRLIRLPRRLHETVAYLRREQPVALMSAKGKDDALALDARDRAAGGVRVFVRCGIHLSSRPKMVSPNPLRRWWHRRRLRRLYARPDGIICVSEGVAEDLRRLTGVSSGRLSVIRNPTITPAFDDLCSAPCPHPWLAAGERPVILGAGSLAPVKRFDVLLDAASVLLETLDMRLIILGEGKQRASLIARAERLGVRNRVDLPGFVGNVLPYMRRAALFVLSSEREGSPNVLTEALACGTPVVATNCPSGPREILADGRYGPLVSVGDRTALRDAMHEVLRRPLRPDLLREAVSEYRLDTAREGYLRAFGLSGG